MNLEGIAIKLEQQLQIAVVEENQLFSEGIKLLLVSSTYEEQNIHQFTNSDTFFKTDITDYDVILMNVEQLLTHKQLIQENIETNNIKIIALANEKDRSLITDVIKLGVRGFVCQETNAELLSQAIQFIINDKPYVDFSCLDYLLDDYQQLLTETKTTEQDQFPCGLLTDREIEVLKLLTHGLPNKLIAEELKVSEKTVNNHVGSIMTKLDVSNRTEAVILALRKGWIKL